MQFEWDTGIIAALIALFGTVLTALFSFRGGMPAAADDMAAGFSALSKELRAEIERNQQKYDASLKRYEDEISELKKRYRQELDELRSRLSALEMSNNYLRGELIREAARSQYFRNGAYRLWYQVQKLKERGNTLEDPAFNPEIDKFPPKDTHDDA